MSIHIACQECGQKLRMKDELAGKRIKCPHCQALLRVPDEEPADAVAEALPVAEEEPTASPQELLAQHTARRKRARVIRVAAVVGLLYGLVSAYGNQNPYYGWFEPSISIDAFRQKDEFNAQIDNARAWKPSPMWLPSYFLCQIGFGVYHNNNARYHFRSFGGWISYYECSTLLGGLLGAGVGAVVAGVMRLRDRKAGPVQPPSASAVLATAGWLVLSLFTGFVFFAVGFGVAAIGARGATQEDARGLPVGFNAMLIGLFLPMLVRRWFWR
jgi:hypothetical protein